MGTVRYAVERGHAILAQFGRIPGRLNRSSRRYLGWIELVASAIDLRHEATSFFCSLLSARCYGSRGVGAWKLPNPLRE